MKCLSACSTEQPSSDSQNRLLSSSLLRGLGVAAGSMAVAGLGLYLYASRIEAKRFALEEISITTGGIDPAVEAKKNGDARPYSTRSLKILHISDLHLNYPEREKVRFVEQCYEQDYDLVVLTGDIFENYSGVQYAKSLLARPPKLGAFAVLGNHDYYHYSWFTKVAGRLNRKYRPQVKRNVEPMVEALREAGFSVLRNEAQSLSEHRIFVVGIDYPGIREDELRRLVSMAPEGYFLLALFHLPINLRFMSRAGVHLGVGGHTHGGQIRIPGFGPLITDSELARHEASGLTWRDNTAFHVSRGLGADPRTNFRLFCPPAATILDVTHHEPVLSSVDFRG